MWWNSKTPSMYFLFHFIPTDQFEMLRTSPLRMGVAETQAVLREHTVTDGFWPINNKHYSRSVLSYWVLLPPQTLIHGSCWPDATTNQSLSIKCHLLAKHQLLNIGTTFCPRPHYSDKQFNMMDVLLQTTFSIHRRLIFIAHRKNASQRPKETFWT